MAATAEYQHTYMPGLPPLPLPPGITSSYLRTPTLTFHILSSGEPTPSAPWQKPLILLLHGFPELAYSWRHIMAQLATLPHAPGGGYRVVAYDQRGYGRTTDWDTRSYGEVDLGGFRMIETVRDAVMVVQALHYETCACIIGHDFGAVGAALAGALRPDVFKRVVLMSHPFTGIPSQPSSKEAGHAAEKANDEIKTCLQELVKLPEPRKHYKWYFSTPEANGEMTQPKQGLAAFLRGYFFLKSGNNSSNHPVELAGWKADELAKMPGYYVMPFNKGVSQTIADDLATHAETEIEESKKWLSDQEMKVYVDEFSRTGFQGGLNYYRVGTDAKWQSDMAEYAGKKIEVPHLFIAGERDWGVYQTPGALVKMKEACPANMGIVLVEGAGHWVMQEKPGWVVDLVRKFLEGEDVGAPRYGREREPGLVSHVRA